jgi:hypothetical protein
MLGGSVEALLERFDEDLLLGGLPGSSRSQVVHAHARHGAIPTWRIAPLEVQAGFSPASIRRLSQAVVTQIPS